MASKCFKFEAEIENEGVLSFPALLLFAAICLPPSPHEAFKIIESFFKPYKKLWTLVPRARRTQSGIKF